MKQVIHQLDPDQRAKQSARELLLETVDMEPKGVIIFAFLKDGRLYYRCSGHIDRLTAMGALEASKAILWED